MLSSPKDLVKHDGTPEYSDITGRIIPWFPSRHLATLSESMSWIDIRYTS